MTLSDADVRATKVPYGKNQFKISDGGGLYLLVKSSGRYWKLAYRFEGKQKTLAFGVYPTVSLDQAREKREEAKKLLAENIDPGEIRKQERIEQRAATVLLEQTVPDGASNKPVFDKTAHTGNQQQPVALNQTEQSMVENRRLSIVQVLANSDGYMANEQTLQHTIVSLGYHISFDRLRTDIAWLYEQQVVQIDTGTLWRIYLTQTGLDAAYGRMWIPGIMRPTVE